MLTSADAPTRLLETHERRSVVIGEPVRPSRYRSFWVLGKFIALFLALSRLAILRRLTHEESARRLRQTFEEIGGLWIKVAQLLSLRIDVFPEQLCRELSRMQERSVGFPA